MKKQVLEILQKYHGFYVNCYLKTLDNEFLHKTRALWEVIEQVEQLPDDDWIEVCERMPEEHMETDTIWDWEKEEEITITESVSDPVLITCESLDGHIEVFHANTVNGQFVGSDKPHFKYLAWKPFPEPFRKDKTDADKTRK